MAKKKQETEKKKFDNPNVIGLHSEVLEQPITETLEIAGSHSGQPAPLKPQARPLPLPGLWLQLPALPHLSSQGRPSQPCPDCPASPLRVLLAARARAG